MLILVALKILLKSGKQIQREFGFQYVTARAGILPTGLIPKTTQNKKLFWVPNPKIPMELRHKPNPTHTRRFFRVIPLGTHGYPPSMGTRLPWVPILSF